MIKQMLKSILEKIMFRYNLINKIILYPDGTMYTLHEDGTKILTYPDKTIIIEHSDYSTVTINK